MDNEKDQKFELNTPGLDTENTAWSPDPTPRDSREIGSRAIENSDPRPRPEISPAILEQSNLPPMPKDTAIVESALDIPFDKNALKTTDKLSQTGIEAIDAAVEKLNQDGDIANFYDTARQMMEANLDNSYNRKLGEGLK